MASKNIVLASTVIFVSIVCCAGINLTVHAGGFKTVGTVTVEGQPNCLAYDSGKGEIFVQNHSDGTISVISDSDNSVVATFPVGDYPQGMAYDSGKGETFESDLDDVGEVVGSSSPVVRVISDSNNSVVATIPNVVGNLAYDPAKGEVFVSQYDTNDVCVISDSTNTVVASIPVGFEATDIVYDSGRGEIWVDNGSYSVSIISDATNRVVGTINVGGQPWGFFSNMAYDPAEGEIFLTSMESVIVISDSTRTQIASVPESAPLSVAYASGRGEVYVANYNSNTTSVISDADKRIVQNIPVDFPTAVVYDSGKDEIFVANGGLVPITGFVGTSVTILTPQLVVPSVFSSTNSVAAGGNTTLTSALDGGVLPYKYQWYVLAPKDSSFSRANNGTSLSYQFKTLKSSPKGNWTFVLQVTDSTGASVNSTATTITVNPPARNTGLPKFNFVRIILITVAIVALSLLTFALLLKKAKNTSATTPEEIMKLGIADWIKYDELTLNGMQPYKQRERLFS